jgi:uncharacterized NAD(P)/FAD-binding protein YdhS
LITKISHMVSHREWEHTTEVALLDSASAARIAVVGVGVGGTLTISQLAEQAHSSWSGATVDIVDRPESLGRGSAFGSDIAAAAINTSQHRLESLSPSTHSFRSWLGESGGQWTDLDKTPMSRAVYGDYLAATLAKAIARLRDHGVRVRFYPMHATSVRPQRDGVAVLGDSTELPPADIAVVAPGVWSPPPPAVSRDVVEAYPLSGLRNRLGDRRSIAILGSGLTAVDVACALDDGQTRVHMLSRSGTLPRVQVEAVHTGDRPEHLTEDAVISTAVWSELTAESVLALLDSELARFGFSRSDIFSDAAHHDHWSELRDALGPKWFRYRVRIPVSRWRRLRDMQADGRLVVHGGVDAREHGLADVLADLGVDRLIPALGQSSDLSEGPALVADLAASGLVDCDDTGQGLVDPATCRALTPGGGPRDDLLLVGQVSAGSYFTVSALDVVAAQAHRAAQTIADAINTRTSLRAPVARKAA